MDFDEEEDELQLLLEGREIGDEKLVRSALKSDSKKSSKSNLKSSNKNQINRRKDVSESEPEDDDDDEEEEEEEEDDDGKEDDDSHHGVNHLNQRQLSNDGFGDDDNDVMQPYGYGEEEEDEGGLRFDEAFEVPGKSDKAKPSEDSSAKKKVVRNPRILLNEDMLKHMDGIVALPLMFKNLKFKGKSHEKEDLNLIMSVYERWAHRLMPSLQFDDFIEKTEILTKKAKMKTFLTKIRNNMTLDIRGGKTDLVPEEADVDSPSDGEGFEPIPYMPEKEYSFSDDDDFLAAIPDVDQILTQTNPVSSSENDKKEDERRTILESENSNQSSINLAEKDVPEVASANSIAKAKRKRMIIHDDSGDDNEDSQPLPSMLIDSDESNQSNKRKRLESDIQDNSQDAFMSRSVLEEDEDEDPIQTKKKRRKLVIIDDEKDEFVSETVNEVEQEQEMNEIVESDSLKKTLIMKEDDEKEVTEEEFLALLAE